jgi:hypothetical protein
VRFTRSPQKNNANKKRKMAIIYSYPTLVPQLGDKVLGSNIIDSAGSPVLGNPTVQYTFNDIKALVNQDYIEQFSSSSAVASQASAFNTAYSIQFGIPVGSATDNVQLLKTNNSDAGSSKLLFNIVGTYQITLTYSVGVNQSATNVPYLVFRTLQNSTTQVGPTIIYNQKFEAVNNPVPLVIPITVNITTPGTYYNFQMARSGVNDGGLVKNAAAINSGIAPTPTAPSIATIKISKLV